MKMKLIAYKGGKCQNPNCPCKGEDLPPYAFDFHHRDPTKKDFTVSGKSCSFEKLKAEVDKCDLLCKICHQKVHWELQEDKRNQRLIIVRKIKDVIHKQCSVCHVNFYTKRKEQEFCSNDCRGIKFRRATRPSKEELNILLWTKPTTEIAKDYGVSDRAISKWAKSYGLEKPSRGYWQKISS